MEIRKSVITKFFIITFAFLIFFITCIFIFQTVFFRYFYTSWKQNTLKRNVEKFEQSYNAQSSSSDIASLVTKFEDDNNSRVCILDKNGNLNFISNNNTNTESASVRVIHEVINNWMSNPGAFIDMKQSGKSLTYVIDSRFSNVKNIVCVFPNTKKNEVIFSVSSLQPIDEASSVINSIFVYVYIGGFIITIILSVIYWMMISKPLIKLNKTATKMANLDFTEKCNMNREDEIGNLGNTLNFLSENLYGAMKSLKNANKKLKSDIDKERNLEKMRRQFVANISHELKTPISLIEGYSEGIKDNVFEDKDRDYYLDVIIDETKKMGILVSDMLDLSQLESGNFKLKMECFYIDKLINAEVKKYYSMFNEKQIDLQINLMSDVLVYGDTMRIEQVLTNFITNAIRYTKKMGKIIIDMKNEEDKVYVYIKNSGEAMSEDELVKIWDKFYKVDKSGNKKLGGTGLGLSITKNILKLHKSDFGVKNGEGEICFYFSLNKVRTKKETAL